jgi:hypothetical protein
VPENPDFLGIVARQEGRRGYFSAPAPARAGLGDKEPAQRAIGKEIVIFTEVLRAELPKEEHK